MNRPCKNVHRPAHVACAICGAGPFETCHLEDPDWLAWLVLDAVRNLKRVDPDHNYVKAVEDCVDTRQGELSL